MSTQAAVLWEQAAADCAEKRRALRTENTRLAERVAHLEELITSWAAADSNYLLGSTEISYYRTAMVTATETALRIEADHIRARR